MEMLVSQLRKTKTFEKVQQHHQKSVQDFSYHQFQYFQE